MSRAYPGIEVFRAVRRQTLALVDGRSQGQLDHRPAADAWSIGEVLEHLRLFDDQFLAEIEALLALAREGKRPFRRQGLTELGFRLPLVPQVFTPFFELPLTVANAILPERIRELFIRTRFVAAQAPPAAQPERGRPASALRSDLRSTLTRIDRLLADHPEIDFETLRLYQPLAGFKTAPGLLQFGANHELRHQAQIRDILASPGFPAA